MVARQGSRGVRCWCAVWTALLVLACALPAAAVTLPPVQVEGVLTAANGIPAAESVARARPDGLTLFATSAMTQVVNPAIYDKLPYDPIADFAPISRMGTSPFVLLVDRSMHWQIRCMVCPIARAKQPTLLVLR